MEIMTYFFYLVVMAVVIISYQIKWKSYNWIAILTLTLVLGLRGCGADTLSYISNFHFYCNINAELYNERYYSPPYNPLYESNPSIEWFYLILIKVIKNVTNLSCWYFLVIDFLSVFLLDRFLQKFCRNEKMFIMFFFFTTLLFVQLFNTMRQLLAFMAFLNIVEYIGTREWKKYFPSNILILALHKSALMLFPFYFFIHKDILKSRIVQYVIYFTVAVLSVVFIEHLKAIMDALYLVVDGGSMINTRYLNSEEQELEMTTSILTTFFYSSTMIYVIWHSTNFKKVYGKIGVIIYNFMFMGMLINNVAFNRGVERLNDYFDSFLFVVLGLMAYQSLFGYYKKNGLMILYTYGLFALYFAWFANSVLQGAAGCAPYVLNPEL